MIKNDDGIEEIEVRRRVFTQGVQTSRIVVIANQKLDQTKYYKSLIHSTKNNGKSQLTPLQRLKSIQAKMKNRPRSAHQGDQEITIKSFTLDLMQKYNQDELKKKLFGISKQQVTNKSLINNILDKKSREKVQLEKTKRNPIKQNQILHKKNQYIFDCIVYGQKTKIRSIEPIQKKTTTKFNHLRFSKQKTLQKHETLCPQFPSNNKYWRDERINNLLQSPKHKNTHNEKGQMKKRRIISSNLFKRQSRNDFEEQIKPWQNKNMDQSCQSPL